MKIRFKTIVIGIIFLLVLVSGGIIYFSLIKSLPTFTPTTCHYFSNNNISGLFDVPELFPGFLWKELNKNQIEGDWRAIGYTKPPDATYYLVDILNGKAWSANYEYKDEGDYKIGRELDRYYSEELSKRGWTGRAYVHGFEVDGIAADGPTGGSHRYIKIQNGKLRTIIIYERGEYEGEFP
ncbi:hypothetical protein KJ671_03585 [Patescibacteria group bacterium]|nr:hypothetical protein [Patescibacteria group bacterium]